MRILLFIFLLSRSLLLADETTYTSFYAKPSGNNLNSGHTLSNAPHFFATGGFWTNTDCVWRKDGMTFTNVVAGDWASVYPDGTTVNPVFIGLVQVVTSTNIWISTTAKSGTSPANDTAGATSIRIGGAWQGPNTNQNPSCIHPFNFVNTAMVDNGKTLKVWLSGYFPVSNAITHSLAGPTIFEGYGTTPGDGVKATIDGLRVTAGYILMTASSTWAMWRNLVFTNNGSTGSSDLITQSGTEQIWENCVFCSSLGHGWNGSTAHLIGCEAFSCGTGASTKYGFVDSAATVFINTTSHHNRGTLGRGFLLGNNTICINCISSTNVSIGFLINGTTHNFFVGCDAWGNGGSGFEIGQANSIVSFLNCNSFDNASSGIGSGTTGITLTYTTNGRLGQGNQTNTLGGFAPVFISGTRRGFAGSMPLYTSNETPWVNETNLNFTQKSLALTKSAGYGLFNTYLTNGNTIGYPDIGSAQSSSTNSTPTTRATAFSQ